MHHAVGRLDGVVVVPVYNYNNKCRYMSANLNVYHPITRPVLLSTYTHIYLDTRVPFRKDAHLVALLQQRTVVIEHGAGRHLRLGGVERLGEDGEVGLKDGRTECGGVSICDVCRVCGVCGGGSMGR